MESRDYITNYKEENFDMISFAWNGKHGGEFEDRNQVFRQAVVEGCIEDPDLASTNLLQKLFIEEAKWAREAWGSPRNFERLGQLLLERHSKEAVRTFSTGMNYSFDTFGACHEITLSAEVIQEVAVVVDQLLKNESDETECRRYESVKELLAKIDGGSATEGWVKVAPDTPVSNVRVIKPSLVQCIKSWFSKHLE